MPITCLGGEEHMDHTREIVASSLVREAIEHAAQLWHLENPIHPRGMDYETSSNTFLWLAERIFLDVQPDEIIRPVLEPALDDIHVAYIAYDDSDQPLYIGVTSNFKQRMTAHKASSAWWPYAARVRALGGWGTRKIANQAELILIRAYDPPWNRNGRVQAL